MKYCIVCGEKLTRYQSKFCSRYCRRKSYAEDKNKKYHQDKEYYKEYYQKNKEKIRLQHTKKRKGELITRKNILSLLDRRGILNKVCGETNLKLIYLKRYGITDIQFERLRKYA